MNEMGTLKLKKEKKNVLHLSAQFFQCLENTKEKNFSYRTMIVNSKHAVPGVARTKTLWTCILPFLSKFILF